MAKNKGTISVNLKMLVDPVILTPSKSRNDTSSPMKRSISTVDSSKAEQSRPKSMSRGASTSAGAGGGGTKAKENMPTSVTTRFRGQLNSLVDLIGSTHTSYVRCVKPNEKKLRQTFDGPSVLRQLRYSGMLEYISIRQTGFGVRRDYRQFLNRYKPLAAFEISSVIGGDDAGDIDTYKLAVTALFTKVQCKAYHWRLGHTLVFMCDEQLNVLESRLAVVEGTTLFVPSESEGCMCRVRHERAAAITIQSKWKMHVKRVKFLFMRKSCKYLQPLLKVYILLLLLLLLNICASIFNLYVYYRPLLLEFVYVMQRLRKWHCLNKRG